MEEMDIEIQDVFKVLKNGWKTIVIMQIVITSFVAVMSFFVIKPVYEVNTKVFIGKEESKNSTYNNNDVVMYLNLLKTYSEIIKSNDLIGNAIYDNNIDITPIEVIDTLEVIPMPDTQILQISYQNNDNVLAEEVIVAVVNEFIKESKQLIPNGTVTVIESAELPLFPISPNKEKNIAVACLVGLMIGSVIVLLKEHMDDTFKTKEQTEKTMDIPVIGMIPCEDKKYSRSKVKHAKKNHKGLDQQVYEEQIINVGGEQNACS